MAEHLPSQSSWRECLHTIIFEADTPAGKTFDVGLLWAIVLSVVVVCLDSVESIRDQFGPSLRLAEWIFTLAFTVEYLLRLACVGRPLRYARSFYGIVDLLAVLPTYLSLAMSGLPSLLVLRALRLLRVFRILKLAHLMGEARQLTSAMKASGAKIFVFLAGVLTLALIMGAIMYLVEGEENGFTSIPRSLYWAIVTLTTVGYGDITPQTPLGQALASLLMILGYGIIAVPTGIISVEINRAVPTNTQACPDCSREGHEDDASHCKYCGAAL
ncbi:MAG: ion transporter [Myxococcota bacterium]|nr:ion transporter [Myxococcota bacterium]